MIKFDLGIHQLSADWRAFFSKKFLKEDLIAGSMVASVALPLSLALALAGNVHPSVGLITAICAGIVCSLFGGIPLAISGPANAMPVIVATIVEQQGLMGLFYVGLGCGILQILTGTLGLGRLIHLVPLPVVSGFTAGIGALILIGQLPRALGLPAPAESHIFEVFTHTQNLIHETQMSSLFLALLTLSITLVLPRFRFRLPVPFIAVLIPSLLAYFFGLNVETIGDFTHFIQLPNLSQFSFPMHNVKGVIGLTLVTFLVASLETLLSVSGAVKLTREDLRSRSDQELIGQGLGNLTSALVGGMPVTGVFARTSLNIQSRARTRRSGIFHSLILVLLAAFFGQWISQIPVAVLAGIILSIAIRMMDPREMIQLWKVSRVEASIYLITFLVIVFVGLVSGIQAGIIAALLVSLIRLSQPNANLESFEAVGASRLSFDGPVTFLSSAKIEEIRTKLSKLDLARGLIVDLSHVKSMDASGASQLIELLEPLVKNKKQFVLVGVSQEHRKLLNSYDTRGITTDRIASSESDIVTILNGGNPAEPLDRLRYGVEKFRKDAGDRYSSLFESLAESQSPHTLFITCSDSRIDTGLITSTHPGELFIVRNVGNIIPIFGGDNMPAEGAAVEFAISVLGVKDIIVCGHSGCGAMKAIQSGTIFTPEQSQKLPSLARWLEQARDLKKLLPPQPSLKQITEHNAVLQLENLKTYPQIIERIKTGEIGLHAWYYNIGEAEIEEWDENQQIFVTVGSKENQRIRNRIESGVQFQVPLDRKKK